MTNDDEKIQQFLLLLVQQRKNMFDLVKQFLVQYNPPAELITELKGMVEDQYIISENEIFDFLDKWSEYRRCLKKSIAIQQVESQKNNFEAMMTKAFPDGIK